jgi:hypothetical protein
MGESIGICSAVQKMSRKIYYLEDLGTDERIILKYYLRIYGKADNLSTICEPIVYLGSLNVYNPMGLHGLLRG